MTNPEILNQSALNRAGDALNLFAFLTSGDYEVHDIWKETKSLKEMSLYLDSVIQRLREAWMDTDAPHISNPFKKAIYNRIAWIQITIDLNLWEFGDVITEEEYKLIRSQVTAGQADLDAYKKILRAERIEKEMFDKPVDISSEFC